MAASRVTAIGKQVVSTAGQGTNVTAIGKQVSFPTHNNDHITAIGKQVVWTDRDQGAGQPPPPVEPPSPPTLTGTAQARGGSFYMDSTLEYDGRHAGSADGLFPFITMTLSGGTTWAAGETLTLTASGDVFVSGDVGNVIVLHGSEVRFTIAAFTSATVVTGTANVAIPASMQGVAVTVWDKAVDQVTGVDHLEGEFLAIYADDHVVGSPYNARITLRQVISGTVDLGDFYTHVFVGLPYISDLETLDIDRPQGSSLKVGALDVTRVGVMLLESRAQWYGRQPPSNDAVDPLEELVEMPQPNDPTYEDLVSDYRQLNVTAQGWNTNGRVFMRSVDPSPWTVLAVMPQGFMAGGG